MKRWPLGFVSVAASVATFGFGGLFPVGTDFAWVVSFVFLKIADVVLIHRLFGPRQPTVLLRRRYPLRNSTPSSFARATAAWR